MGGLLSIHYNFCTRVAATRQTKYFLASIHLPILLVFYSWDSVRNEIHVRDTRFLCKIKVFWQLKQSTDRQSFASLYCDKSQTKEPRKRVEEGQCLNNNNNSVGWMRWLLKNLSVGVGYGQSDCQRLPSMVQKRAIFLVVRGQTTWNDQKYGKFVIIFVVAEFISRICLHSYASRLVETVVYENSILDRKYAIICYVSCRSSNLSSKYGKLL